MAPLVRANALIAALLLSASFLAAQEAPPPEPAPAAEQAGVETLARGPVHEAFAEPVVFNPEPGSVIEKQPPEPVEEVVPEEAPAGQNVIWISGYWSWDEDRNDYVWVSGFWRETPPGRRWVAGYWRPTEGGFQRVSGFWATAAAVDVTYYPPPPESLEAGPVTTAPGDNYFWVPGCWQWRNAAYAWQAGYWSANYADWIWVPHHYTWCPRGYVFVPGYWDFVIARRGCLFAPAYIDHQYWGARDFRYYPRFVVDVGLFTNHLFINPQRRCYYFGDYYDRRYGDRGYMPWFAAYGNSRCYDPLYVHYHHRYGQKDRDWEHNLRDDFERRRDHADERPAHTFAKLKPESFKEGERTGRPDWRKDTLVKPLVQVAKDGGPSKFVRVDANVRRDLTALAADQEIIGRTRGKLESSTDGKLAERIGLPDTGRDNKDSNKAEPRRDVLKPSLDNRTGRVTRSPEIVKDGKERTPDVVRLPQSRSPFGGIQTDGGRVISRENKVIPRDEKYIPRDEKYIPREEKAIPRDEKFVPREKKPIPREEKPIPREEKPIPREEKPIPREEKPIPREEKPIPREEKPIPRDRGPSSGTTREPKPGIQIIPGGQAPEGNVKRDDGDRGRVRIDMEVSRPQIQERPREERIAPQPRVEIVPQLELKGQRDVAPPRAIEPRIQSPQPQFQAPQPQRQPQIVPRSGGSSRIERSPKEIRVTPRVDPGKSRGTESRPRRDRDDD